MSCSSLDSGCEPCAVRALAHLFYCPTCPSVSKFSRVSFARVATERDRPGLRWRTDKGRDVVVVNDFRDAELALVVHTTRELCEEGYALVREARARGWGT